ncbi:16S rRNA processing protein RimM [Hydrogenivirga caldilitoris]|uniref:Ribosome maturation factor RimM n=1 Tax=Hydrogenivirga caldilitoris TaxID=246264 RepID=A0A497XQX0_9AQUI|nr:ribosome maturation factor RimM [Hydrogenivirga caldilitoris]RLJ70681.1 16S rRNA processing protein RimM [Hydrogenivirga caldilitoris]
MEYIVIGKVIDTFGVKGELKVLPMAPEEVFEKLKRVYLKRVGGEYVPFKVEGVRRHENFLLIKFKGYNDLGSVEQFKGAHLFLPEKELPKRDEEEFYAYELIGMEVVTNKGKRLGKVKRVEDFGVYDMLVLENEKIMIPFVSDIVLNVDRRERRIEVKEELVLF